MVELSDAIKQAIRLEELYRREVRSKLDEDTSRPSKVNAFLNSAFGVWLLSAVFLSLSGAMYQRWEKIQNEKNAIAAEVRERTAASDQAVDKLDVEISYRLSQILLRLSEVADQAPDAVIVVRRQFDAASVRPVENRDVLYPEYSLYSVPTLLVELRRELKDHERDQVESSLAAWAALVSRTANDENIRNATPEAIARTLLKEVVLRREWKNTRFHFVDCTPGKPFC